MEAVYSKRLTESLGFSIGGGVLHLAPDHGSAETGFSNASIQVKYEIVESAEHEALLSAALGWEIGGTGDRSIGASSFDVVTPSIFFAKGFGDLPETLSLLKPLAVTGMLGTAIPTRTSSRAFDPASNTTTTRRNPNVFEWGFAVEYSMPYLEEVVGLAAVASPFNHMVPLVEVSLATPLDRSGAGKTFGTVNPGVAWLAAGNRFQLTLEAAIPVNDRSGKTVGVRASFNIFLNRLFPASRLFRPLFGE